MSGSAYTVSASLNIRGNYTQVMRQLGRSLASLNKQITDTEANLVRLMGRLPALATLTTRSAAVAGSAMGGLRSQVQGVTNAVSGTNRALGTQVANLNRLSTAARASTLAANSMAAAMRTLSQVPPPPRIPPPPRGGRGGGGGGGGGGAGGGGIGGGAYGAAREGLRTMGVYAPVRSGARGIWNTVKAAGEVQTLETLMQSQQVPQDQIDRLRGEIPKWLEQAPGANVAEAMQAFSEARQAVGDDNGRNFGPAFEIAPMILRAARVAAVTNEKTTAEGLRPLARFLAIRGSFTDNNGNLVPGTGADELRAIESALLAFTTATGEGIKVDEIENLAKQMSIAGRRMSIQGIIGPMMSLVQERGGYRAGTELTAFSDQVVSGTMLPATAKRFGEVGLLRPTDPAGQRRALAREDAIVDRLVAEGRLRPEEAATAKERARTPMLPGSTPTFGRGLATVREDLWLQQVFQPIATEYLKKRAAARGERNPVINEDAILDLYESLKLRGTSRRFGMAMLQTREVESDISNVNRIEDARRRGEDPAGNFMRQSFAGALGNMQGSFMALLQELGKSESIVALLNDLAKSFRDLAAVVRENPGFMDSVIAEVRRFIAETKQFVTDLAYIVTTIAGLVRLLREGGIAAVAAELIPKEKREGIQNFNRRVDEARDAIDALPGRAIDGARGLFPDRVPSTEPDTAPLPPSWGGPDPRSRRGGIQLNNFQPMPGGGRETVVQTVINLDGRVLTDVVTRHQGRAASGPIQGPDRFDLRRGIAAGGEALA